MSPRGFRTVRTYHRVRTHGPPVPDDPRRSADEALLRFVLGRPDPTSATDDDDEEDAVSEDEARSRPQGEPHTHTWYDQRDVRHDVDCTCAVGADHTTPPLPGGRDR